MKESMEATVAALALGLGEAVVGLNPPQSLQRRGGLNFSYSMAQPPCSRAS
jgi:hypothetical protein